MFSWLTRVLSDEPSPAEETVALLEESWRDGEAIDLLSAGEASRRISFALHDITAEGLLISNPTIGQVGHRLAVAERFTLRVRSRGRVLLGATECLRRARTTRHGETIHGFLLSLPASLAPQRRAEPKPAPARQDWIEAAGEAQIIALRTQMPIFGRVIEIHPDRFVLRCRNAAGKIDEGETIELRLDLPKPVGKLNEPARVRRVWTDARSGQSTVDLQLLRMIKEIEHLRSGRRRAG